MSNREIHVFYHPIHSFFVVNGGVIRTFKEKFPNCAELTIEMNGRDMGLGKVSGTRIQTQWDLIPFYSLEEIEKELAWVKKRTDFCTNSNAPSQRIEIIKTIKKALTKRLLSLKKEES